jgi:hypothetical protein
MRVHGHGRLEGRSTSVSLGIPVGALLLSKPSLTWNLEPTCCAELESPGCPRQVPPGVCTLLGHSLLNFHMGSLGHCARGTWSKRFMK